jgi:hypothetical protein
MAFYLDSIVTEYYNGTAWVDLTPYVVGDISGNNGLGGWRPEQRVAMLGTLNLTLNNKSKVFSPMGGDAVRGLSTLTGFNKSAKIRVRGVVDGISRAIWTGRITSLDSDDKNWGNEQVRLMAADWMQVPANYPMAGATIALNQTIDEAMTLVLARLSLQPEATDFDAGAFTFPAVFDNVQRKTMALSEFTKLANSELGYIYLNQDGTLRVENILARNGWRALDQVWVIPAGDSFLLNEDGTFLLLETGGKIILNEGAYADAAIAADAESYNILLAEDALLNAAIIRVHPVITDTSLKVLYTLGTPLFIPSGKTAEFSAHYTDPSGLAQVSGTNMQTPVATTDYLSNTAADGSGTNKTADLVVTATYYGDTVYYSITNNATAGVYVTRLQARGYGIYYANSIEATIDDAVSQSAYGYTPFQFDMRYQKDPYLADMYGLAVIEEYKMPKSRITKMKYLANLNSNHMMSFLVLSVGALLLGVEDRSGISNHYYITDRAFTIKQGGIINVEYGVKQNDSYLSGGLNPVTAEFTGEGATDAIDYGYLPQIADADNRSVSVWVYIDEFDDYGAIIGKYSDASGYIVRATSTNQNVQVDVKFASNQMQWTTPVSSLSTGAWTHIVVTRPRATYDVSPIVYIDGVSQVVSTISAPPAGLPNSELGNHLILGNAKTLTIDYAWGLDGKIFDARVYNRILTQAEVTTLYNAGTPDETLVTDGVVFQGPAVYADQGDDASLAGTILASTDRLVENALRAVGIPHGAPVLRANP